MADIAAAWNASLPNGELSDAGPLLHFISTPFRPQEASGRSVESDVLRQEVIAPETPDTRKLVRLGSVVFSIWRR